MAYQVESAITASDGRGVLWVLDSWDALPSHLRERSLLRDMIITPNRSCLLYTSPSPRDATLSRMPSSA